MKEVIDLNISFDTTFEDIELLRSEMEKFVRHPDNSRDFDPNFSIGVGGVGDLDKLNLKIAIKHKSNWHNEAVRATRRSKFICALALALKRIPIYGPGGGADALGAPENPTYSVAVSDVEAAAARTRAAKEREAARMVVPKPERTFSNASRRDGGIAGSPEMQAAQNITSMDQAVAAAEDWANIRDDNTLNSQEEAQERSRANDIENLRTDLRKQESQRSGRRQAGATLAHTLSHRASRRPDGGDIQEFDEEAQIGSVSPYLGAQPYTAFSPTAGPSTSNVARGPSVSRSGNNPFQQSR